MIRRLLTIIIALALPAGAVAQTTIELRSSAALKAGEPITLGDIAEVMGDDAEAVAGTVIEAAPASRAFDIEVKDGAGGAGRGEGRQVGDEPRSGGRSAR